MTEKREMEELETSSLHDNAQSQVHHEQPNESSHPAPRNINILCWWHHNLGPVQAQCPLQEEPMDCAAEHGVSYC